MKYTIGPWRACNKGKCVCGQIWSEPADFPVATVTTGKWGDEYPRIRLTDDNKAEAYMEMIEYGEVPKEMAEANAHLIAASPDLLDALKEAKEIIRCWHGEVAWDIYDKASPEMKRINAAIQKAEGSAS